MRRMRVYEKYPLLSDAGRGVSTRASSTPRRAHLAAAAGSPFGPMGDIGPRVPEAPCSSRPYSWVSPSVRWTLLLGTLASACRACCSLITPHHHGSSRLHNFTGEDYCRLYDVEVEIRIDKTPGVEPLLDISLAPWGCISSKYVALSPE